MKPQDGDQGSPGGVDLTYRVQHPAIDGQPAVGPFQARSRRVSIAGCVVDETSGQIPDAQGRLGAPAARVYDTLATLHRNGTIDDAMLAAGREFEEQFRRAGLDPMRALDMARVSGASCSEAMMGGSKDAKDWIAAAIKALGGHGSPVASCAWHVLGVGLTIARYSELTMLGAGLSLNPHEAKGVLLGALGLLAAPGDSAGGVMARRRRA